MKNAIWYKDSWLMPNSTALELFKEWKKQTDPKSQKDARKKFEDHVKDVSNRYNILAGCAVHTLVK